MTRQTMNRKLPRVVIVGGGFGGLAAAKALRWAPAEVILIDRTNHHLFQPLLYQVATSVLAPSQISAPIRGIPLPGENPANGSRDLAGCQDGGGYLVQQRLK